MNAALVPHTADGWPIKLCIVLVALAQTLSWRVLQWNVRMRGKPPWCMVPPGHGPNFSM